MHLNKLIISFFFNLKKEFLINVIFILISYIPDEEFKYICHTCICDHFSRFSWTKIFTSKKAVKVL